MEDKLSNTERWLMRELFRINQEVASLILRSIEASSEENAPPTTNEKFQVGGRLLEIGTELQTRAMDQARTQSPVKSMHENTYNLLEALRAISEQLPRITCEIASDQISPEQQVEFAELVIRVGELVKLHAWEVRGYA
jgi:hypothetical protein